MLKYNLYYNITLFLTVINFLMDSVENIEKKKIKSS